MLFSPLNPPISDWNGRRIWLVGASSGIGAALARALLSRGASVAVSARSRERLLQVAHGYEQALVLPFDAVDGEGWSAARDHIHAAWGGIDLVVYCAADYKPQHSWELQQNETQRTLELNIGGLYLGLETILPGMLAAGRGGVAVVASVAGYMGLPKAAVYGPSKAALINLAELLYVELHRRGVDVYLINPGFVRTRLTAKNSFAMPALQTPEQAAERIVRGFERGCFEIHFPHRFTLLLKLVRLLPYRWRFFLFDRLPGLV